MICRPPPSFVSMPVLQQQQQWPLLFIIEIQSFSLLFLQFPSLGLILNSYCVCVYV